MESHKLHNKLINYQEVDLNQVRAILERRDLMAFYGISSQKIVNTSRFK